MQTEFEQKTPKRRFGWLQVMGIVIVTILISVIATLWLIQTYVFPTKFKPVELDKQETQALQHKLDQLEQIQLELPNEQSSITKPPNSSLPLEPEPYHEKNAVRELFFTEKELNALLAKNTDLAQKLAIDLSDNLMSAKLLVLLEPEFPVLGGKTIKVNAGVELGYAEGKPILILRGISIMGVPLPNAWLGGIKHVDLIKEFGAQPGFWKAFADGIEHINVDNGNLKIKLKE